MIREDEDKYIKKAEQELTDSKESRWVKISEIHLLSREGKISSELAVRLIDNILRGG